MSRLLRRPAMAADPVSPEVAPRIFKRCLCLASAVKAAFLRAKKYSNRFPKNCNATSLKAKVGPCQSSRIYSASRVFTRGVISECLKVEYDRLTSS